MSDFAAFLTHAKYRNIPWTGHATFPKGAVRHNAKITAKHNRTYELRIFELDWTEANTPMYHLLSEAEVAAYME